MAFPNLRSAAIVLLAAALTVRADNEPLHVMFINETPEETIDLYWEDHALPDDHPERRRLEARIKPRGHFHLSESYLGHEFSYDLDGDRHYVSPPRGNANDEQFVTLAGDRNDFRVRCEITVNAQRYLDTLDFLVKPYWAPRAASRFLELVRMRYYDGVAFNRVVPEFLAQFGISKDYVTRKKQRKITLWDDFSKDVKFEPGMVSFAGNGNDSRSTEIFVIMPDTPQEKLDEFGTNSWETPFAVIDGDLDKLKKLYSGYGDMAPWGEGPDPNKIYGLDGYISYLPKRFPKLDYIDRCYVVDEVGLDNDDDEL